MPFVTPAAAPVRPHPAVTSAYERASRLAMLVARGTPEAAREIAGFLASTNAALRNDALDALQRMGEAAEPAVDELLEGDDPEPRLLAVEVTRAWASARAVPRLLRVLESDPHVNVCAAAVDVAADTGTAALLAPLAALRTRFADAPFLVFAADVARARIAGGGTAIP
jgi:HEAT repeat protein